MVNNRKEMLITGSMKSLSLAGILLLAASLWIGCSSKETLTNLSAEERFQRAKTLFDNADYLEAINEFTVITLQFQGSAVAGDAQFYLAECRFKRNEFLLASYEYQTLRRNMPASPRVPEAMYKLGLAFYSLAPKSRLDQQYTKRAIDELQAFVEYYPTSEFVADASAKIQELNTRLAKKEFDTAQLYATMEYNKSAIFYFDNVIEKYHDTEYAPLAYLSKVELLMARKKFSDAKAEITKFLSKYPNSVLRARGDALEKEIDLELKNAPSASGKESGTNLDASSGANLLRAQ
jgi:outer membrane protein assembly factor BamD